MNSQNYQKILHEIKNTVTLINSSAQLLNSKCPQLHSEPYWDNIRQEITYLKNMVLEISQAGKPAKRSAGCKSTDSECLPVYQRCLSRFAMESEPLQQPSYHICRQNQIKSGRLKSLKKFCRNWLQKYLNCDMCFKLLCGNYRHRLWRRYSCRNGT